MRIKKFVGPTLKELTEQMKRDLGPEAIILSTRKITKGGLMSFLGKEMFEITAALDDEVAMTGTSSTYLHHSERRQAVANEENTVESLRKVAEHFNEHMRRAGSVKARALASNELAELHHLKGEVEEIKAAIQGIAVHLKYSKLPAVPEHLQEAYLTLVGQAVQEQLAADLVQTVHSQCNGEHLRNKQEVEKHILAAIASIVKTADTTKPKKKKTKVVALVGPTGVGKTTTIAKLAAVEKLFHHLDVALVTSDTYRIGAIEQLRTFAALAHIPLEIVYKPTEMRVAFRKLQGKDIIFLDTVGRSQRRDKELSELRKFVEAAEPDEIHLVLNASAAAQTLTDVVDRFRVVGPNRFLFSKLDEAVTFGPLLNIVHQYRVPLSYFTTGQVVPDDIVTADSNKMATLVYTGALPNA